MRNSTLALLCNSSTFTPRFPDAFSCDTGAPLSFTATPVSTVSPHSCPVVPIIGACSVLYNTCPLIMFPSTVGGVRTALFICLSAAMQAPPSVLTAAIALVMVAGPGVPAPVQPPLTSMLAPLPHIRLPLWGSLSRLVCITPHILPMPVLLGIAAQGPTWCCYL